MMTIKHRFPSLSKTHNQQGLTLIEILVAVVILSVGLLGLAGLQVMGLKNISISGNHSHATILANDLVERMRINRDNIGDYTSPVGSDCLPPPAGTVSIALMDYCDIYYRASGDLNGDGDIADAGERRLLRPFTGNEYIEISLSSSAISLYTIELNWAEQNHQGSDILNTYSFNFKP
ncbi:type IV pilus modification protein PilV [Pseudomonadota bacterium]